MHLSDKEAADIVEYSAQSRPSSTFTVQGLDLWHRGDDVSGRKGRQTSSSSLTKTSSGTRCRTNWGMPMWRTRRNTDGVELSYAPKNSATAVSMSVSSQDLTILRQEPPEQRDGMEKTDGVMLADGASWYPLR
jgi:hypothetical protein